MPGSTGEGSHSALTEAAKPHRSPAERVVMAREPSGLPVTFRWHAGSFPRFLDFLS